MENSKKFYTVPEAAEKFGVNRRTMSTWVATGKIKSLVTPGGHHRILCSEIESVLEQSRFLKTEYKEEKTILIVDDDESIRKTLKQRLIRENFNVETASNGFQAGLKARDINPDLIILDLVMEGIDGFEVCRTVKSDPSLKDTKILIMTGFDSSENQKRAIQEGADLFLSKGASFQKILNFINELLSK